MSCRRLVMVAFVAVILVSPATVHAMRFSAVTDDLSNETDRQKAERMAWFTDARFGMFIHWGPVSLKGTEIGWSRGGIPIEEYDNLYKSFNPVKFDASQWVAVAKAAGMKYMVLTAKHHDGFCLWDTKQTDYNIMNSPFGRDVVKELAAECRKQGIVFCTYYSILDWYHPDYPLYSHGGPGYKLPDGEEADMGRFVAYIKAQLRELIEGYGPLGLIWFDGEWEQPWTADLGDDMYEYVRSLQPSIIINNRVSKGREGMAGTTAQTEHNPGDYDTPEQRIGAFNNDRPWETCMTICQQWAWKPNDNMKSFKECIQTLVKTVGGDGNLLFNVGPMPDGRIEARQVDRLKEMGQWLEKYGKTIYGSRGGPFKPGLWGVSTHKGKNIYLHVLNFAGEEVVLPAIGKTVKKAELLTGGSVSVTGSSEGLVITVPKECQNEVDTIIKLTLNGKASDIEPLDVPSLSLTAGKEAVASNVYEKQVKTYGPQKACDDDDATRWATDSGTKSAWLEVDLAKSQTFTKAVIKEAYAGRVQKFELQKLVGDNWQVFHAGARLGANTVIEFEAVTAQKVRFAILEATEGPTIYEFQLLK